jgi:hypothetical protein
MRRVGYAVYSTDGKGVLYRWGSWRKRRLGRSRRRCGINIMLKKIDGSLKTRWLRDRTGTGGRLL